MSNVISYIKENREKIAYSYYYLSFFALMCFIGWACNNLYVSYISLSLFLIITPLLNKDMRLLLLPALLSFTCYRSLFGFENIPIPVLIVSVSFSLSLFIYIVRIRKEIQTRPKLSIFSLSFMVFGLLCLISTVIRHIFFNSYSLNNYYSEFDIYWTHHYIDWSQYTNFYKIYIGYLISLLMFLLSLVSILLHSAKNNSKYFFFKIMYIFSAFIIIQLIYTNLTKTSMGWGGKNLVSIAILTTISPLVYLYSRNYKRIDIIIIIALEALFLLIYKAKGALLTLLLISPYLLYMLLKKVKHKWICISIYSFIIITTAILFITIPKFNGLLIDKSGSYDILNGREYYWKWITDYVSSNPAHMIFGGSPVFLFEMYPGFYITFVNSSEPNIPFAPFLCHNTILTTLAMGGIIGLIALLLHRIFIVRQIIIDNNDDKHMILCFIIIGIILGLIDNTFYSVIYFVPYMIFLSDCSINFNKTNDNLGEYTSNISEDNN